MVPCDITYGRTTDFALSVSAIPSWIFSRVSALMSPPLCSGLVGLGQERIGIELFRRQPALQAEILARRLDHDGRAASVDLHAGHVREILHHRAVHETGAPAPLLV